MIVTKRFVYRFEFNTIIDDELRDQKMKMIYKSYVWLKR